MLRQAELRACVRFFNNPVPFYNATSYGANSQFRHHFEEQTRLVDKLDNLFAKYVEITSEAERLQEQRAELRTALNKAAQLFSEYEKSLEMTAPEDMKATSRERQRLVHEFHVSLLNLFLLENELEVAKNPREQNEKRREVRDQFGKVASKIREIGTLLVTVTGKKMTEELNGRVEEYDAMLQKSFDLRDMRDAIFIETIAMMQNSEDLLEDSYSMLQADADSRIRNYEDSTFYGLVIFPVFGSVALLVAMFFSLIMTIWARSTVKRVCTKNEAAASPTMAQKVE